MALALVFSFGLIARAADAPPHPIKAPPPVKGKVDFIRDVRPVLSARCFACHGSDEGSRKAKLRLDVRDEAIKDRKGTRAIAPGNLAQSEMVKRITTKDEDDVMPPPKEGHPLTPQEIQMLKRWIEQGASYAEHWAFIKPQPKPVPAVRQRSWPISGLDYFILSRLEKEGMSPAPRADRYTLIRRVSLDLTGLPPTTEEVDAFIADKSRDAYEKVVDRLLRSPAYGERWARMWLDLARYADSAGYGSDPLRLNIWPYRDWVIKAFNRNLSYDRFTLEQIAGDLLGGDSDEYLVPTAFHRNTMTNTEGGTDDEEFRVAAVKDRIGTTAQVWMGLTMGCAQCHSHKYDPISQKEYYQFYALFNQTEDNDQPDERPTLALPTAMEKEKMDRLKKEVAAVEKEIATPTAKFKDELAEWEKSQAKGIDWTPLELNEFESAGGATLTKLSDQSLLATGRISETDTYTLKVRTQLEGITAVRIEVLPDQSLPESGPGRSPNGRLVLSGLKVGATPAKAEPKKARFVRVEMSGESRILSLAEVQVLSGHTNHALHGKASQSSVQPGGDAARAVDGVTDGDLSKAKSTTLTKSEDNPWWEVDLGAELPVEEIRVWNRTDSGLGTRLIDFQVSAMDASRKKVFEMKVNPPPSPVSRFSLIGEKAVTLQNATADFSAEGFGADKALDRDGKTGWSTGATNPVSHFAIFETSAKVGDPGGTVLAFTLEQNNGETNVIGRFRLSATTHALPVRVPPEKIVKALASKSDDRTETQKKDLEKYFQDFAPSLAKTREKRDKLKKDLDAVKPVALPIMRDLATDKSRATKILVKGNFLAPGDEVQPAFPAAFNPPPPGTATNRLGVARWLVNRDNPLTARVTVNRFWAQIFGIGLVETEEDFGTQGALPSHPDLLDWMAIEFMDSGWNIKGFLKELVMSASYQQSSRASTVAMQKDPRNRLLSHAPRSRLDAEGIRDQALALSGLLSHKIGGPSVYPPQPDGLWRAAFNGQRNWATSVGEDRFRRGLYTFWRRTIPYPSMSTFDAPSRENCTMRRLPTNTPLQAFVTMNDPAYVEMSQALGRRIIREGGATPVERVRFGLKLCLSRPPTDEQVVALLLLYNKELSNYREHPDAARKLAAPPMGAAAEESAVVEEAAWTVVGNVLLNLDGVLTKG